MQAMVLYRSSIGKKAIMAVTGVIWVGFVILHMYGNLKLFMGPAYFNGYAEGLREVGAPIFSYLHLLILARIILVTAVVLHVWSAWSLYLQAQQARPANYVTRKVVQANYPSLTMRYGGALIVLFLIYHLMQFTWGVRLVESGFVRGDAYHNVVSAFQFWPITLVYLLALFVLGFHLFHGTWSMFQTLGLNNRNYDQTIRGLAWVLGVLIPVGFATVPLAILLGIVH